MQQRIGHYVVEAPLGRGAMGAVYLARDQRIGRRVAIKQVHLAATQFEDSASAAEFYQRLQREAEVCGSLQHPNIVTLYDVGYEHDRISYLALEFVAGETLLELLKRHRPGPLAVEVALRIAADILRGLAYAHGKGIIHRDIKPANILIAHDGTAKIADFGIARPQASSITLAGAMIGTPNYMPPEQVKGLPATPRSDLFSLGVLLFEMVTGTKPFAADELAAILEKIVRTPTPSVAAINPDASADLDSFIQRLTAKVPEDRFATAGEALQALEQLRSTATSSTPIEREVVEPSQSVEEEIDRAAPEAIWALRRTVPAPVFLGLILAAAFAVAAPSIVIWTRIAERPTIRITDEQFAEFARKRESLRAADELFRTGQYAESAKAYEAYLARYPHSTVAREGADRARAALKDSDRARPKQPQSKKERPFLEGIKRNVKRLFRGK